MNPDINIKMIRMFCARNSIAKREHDCLRLVRIKVGVKIEGEGEEGKKQRKNEKLECSLE